MRSNRTRRILLPLVVLTTACGGGEPPPSDPALVWSEAVAWVPGEAGLLGDDWAYATEASDSLPQDLVERVATAVAAVEGDVRVLAVTRDACIDSAHTIPYLAALANAVSGLELRVAHPRLGGALMEAHRTPDGRAATPTVLFLDEAGEVRGCWLERPASLQTWYLENPDELGRVEKFATKTEWYEADRGAHTLSEVALVLEAVVADTPICGLPLDSIAALPEPGSIATSAR